MAVVDLVDEQVMLVVKALEGLMRASRCQGLCSVTNAPDTGKD